MKGSGKVKLSRWVLLVLLLMMVIAPNAKAESFGVRTIHNQKVGVWVCDLKNINKGKASSIAKLCHRYHISYLIVRTHKPWDNGHRAKKAEWYRLCPRKSFVKLLRECHKYNVKVYAWMYTYGNGTDIELAMANQAIRAKCDGFVLDAEGEYTKKERYKNALGLCAGIRQLINKRTAAGGPPCVLVYSTFARSEEKTQGHKFPYVLFNKYCDQVWPQTYWKTFTSRKKKWTPGGTVREIDGQFRNKYRDWQKKSTEDHKFRARIPWVHTGQAYDGESNTKPISPVELDQFLEANWKAGHNEENVYTLDKMTTAHLEVIKKFADKKPISKANPYRTLLAKNSKDIDPKDLIAEKSFMRGGPLLDPDEEDEESDVVVSANTDAEHQVSFWRGWLNCLIFRPPWWEAWKACYWTIMLLIVLGSFIPPLVVEIDVCRRRQIAAIGTVAGLAWPVILAVGAWAITTAVTLAAIAVIVMGLVRLVKFFKESRLSQRA